MANCIQRAGFLNSRKYFQVYVVRFCAVSQRNEKAEILNYLTIALATLKIHFQMERKMTFSWVFTTSTGCVVKQSVASVHSVPTAFCNYCLRPQADAASAKIPSADLVPFNSATSGRVGQVNSDLP